MKNSQLLLLVSTKFLRLLFNDKLLLDQPIEVTTVDDASAKAAYAVAIFIVAIAALLAGVYCYQKRKKKLDQLDALSVVSSMF